jgi:Leucine-rich repeat (LRR) protein
LESNNIRDLPRQLFHCQELRVLKLADNDLHILPNAVSSLAHLQGTKSI